LGVITKQPARAIEAFGSLSQRDIFSNLQDSLALLFPRTETIAQGIHAIQLSLEELSKSKSKQTHPLRRRLTAAYCDSSATTAEILMKVEDRCYLVEFYARGATTIDNVAITVQVIEMYGGGGFNETEGRTYLPFVLFAE